MAKETVTVLAPDGSANVIVSIEPIATDLDAYQYAIIQGDMLRREFPGYAEHTITAHRVFGRDGYVRYFSWSPPDGVRVSQLQAYATEPGRGFSATATAPTADIDRQMATLVSVIDHLAVR